jgi:ribosome-binding protein aMBF1 (putative translation factor)
MTRRSRRPPRLSHSGYGLRAFAGLDICGGAENGFLTKSSEMEIQAAIGNRIRTLRLQRGFSQEKFAAICGVHRSHMGEIERGEKDVTISTLQKISKGLDIALSVLLENVS